MTTIDGDRFDAQLAAFLAARSEDIAGVRGPDAMALAIAGPGRGPRDRRRVALALAVVGLLAALLVAGLVGIGGQRPALPVTTVDTPARPAASAPPSGTLSTAPGEADSFVSDSPFGRISWRWVTTGVRVDPWAFMDGRYVGLGENGDWYESLDGLSWDPAAAMSFEPSEILDEEAGLRVRSPSSVGRHMGPDSWRQVIKMVADDSPDDPHLMGRAGIEWVDIPLPETPAPPTQGLLIHAARYEGGAAKGREDWVLPVSRFIEVPWDEALGLQQGVVLTPQWNPYSKVYQIGGRNLSIEMSDGPERFILVRDAESRAIVYRVKASYLDWTPKALLDAVRSWGFDDTSLIVSRGGQISVVRPPWPRGEEWFGGIVSAVDRYFAVTHELGPDYSAAAAHLWMSEDGITWSKVALPDMTYAGTLDHVELTGDDDTLFIRVDASLGESLWRSTDGVGWRRVDIDPTRIGRPTHFDRGWLMQSSPWHVLFSTDGTTWADLPLPSMPAAEASVVHAGDRFFYGPAIESGNTYGTWVGTLGS